MQHFDFDLNALNKEQLMCNSRKMCKFIVWIKMKAFINTSSSIAVGWQDLRMMFCKSLILCEGSFVTLEREEHGETAANWK